MKRWITSDIVQLLTSIPNVQNVIVSPPGGDVDTENLVVQFYDGKVGDPNADDLHVCGFITESHVKTPADTYIDMIEVSDGLDSRGGLNSGNVTTCAAYGMIVARLRQADFKVVASLRDYF
jgi:hypothetical protein